MTSKAIIEMTQSRDFKRVLDRSCDYLDLVEPMLGHWSYDLYARKPRAALVENGALKPTDLDLACFMSALAQRGAVINLPTYQGRRPRTEKSNEHTVSRENRHGKVMSLSANKEVFSFSVRINDMNVITQGATGDNVGAPRSFMLVDIDGEWHEGWRHIEFLPTAKENSFLNDHGLWTGNTVVFQNFVHPNRWVSLYGSYYLMSKLLLDRMTAETVWRRTEQKRLLDAGVTFPVAGNGRTRVNDEDYPTSTREEGVSEQVDAFQAEVDAPWTGEFPMLAKTGDALKVNAQTLHELQYVLIPQLRFAVRATELAFFHKSDAPMPAWMVGSSWQDHLIKRTTWRRLQLTTDVALRTRVYTKSERVRA